MWHLRKKGEAADCGREICDDADSSNYWIVRDRHGKRLILQEEDRHLAWKLKGEPEGACELLGPAAPPADPPGRGCGEQILDTGQFVIKEKSKGRALIAFRGGELNGDYELSRNGSAEERKDLLASFIRELNLGEPGEELSSETLTTCRTLIEDGRRARREAIERLCSHGQELDGELFPDQVWRTSLDRLRLEEINTHLAVFQQRFDKKYPPVPVTHPEELDAADDKKIRRKEVEEILAEL